MPTRGAAIPRRTAVSPATFVPLPRRSDPTEALARRLRRLLDPGEVVFAGVKLIERGSMSGAVSDAASAAAGSPVLGRADERLLARRQRHRAIGIQGYRFYLLLTDARLLLVRRNSMFGFAREVTFQAPIGDVAELRVTRQSSNVTIRLTSGETLELETTRPIKRLPPVYLELPQRLVIAQRTSS